MLLKWKGVKVREGDLVGGHVVVDGEGCVDTHGHSVEPIRLINPGSYGSESRDGEIGIGYRQKFEGMDVSVGAK